MRITGGEYRGRLLQSPKDRSIRPTSDKVRQAVFNILHSRDAVVGAAVLDAFCGTGALGLEAVSRGALCCTFMDKNRRSLELAKDNFAALKIDAKENFVLKDVSKPGPLLQGVEPATLVFLDPPYRQGLVQQSMPALRENGWIAPSATLLIETESDFLADLLLPLGCTIDMVRDYGETRIILATL